jgi:hypothetical protein
MAKHVREVRAETKKKKAVVEEQERVDSGHDTDVIRTDSDEEVQLFDPATRRAMDRSRAEAWEADQRRARGIVSGAGAGASGAGASSKGPIDRARTGVKSFFGRAPPLVSRPQKMRADISIEDVDPNYFSREHGKQTRIEDAFDKKGPRHMLGKAVAKFWHHAGIAFNAANSPYYKTMIQEAQVQGLHVKPPTAKELGGIYLDEQVEEIKEYIGSFKKKWKKYGVTLMCDGWSGTTKSSLINFLVYCDKQVFYHKSIDASNEIHNYEYILGLMNTVVDEIGEDYIVQVVTDNGSAYKKAGEELMNLRPHIFWTPCAAHCVDLMLKEIGKLDSVKKAVDAGQKITRYIYNHHFVLRLMRDHTGGDLLRPGITRFATNFIALQSLLKHQAGLKQMFRSDKWLGSTFATSSDGKTVEAMVNSVDFWKRIDLLVRLIEPLYEVLRVVDGDRQPTIGLVYSKIEAAKKKMKEISPRYAPMIVQIVENRWDRQMSRDLHMAGELVALLYIS